MGLVNRDQEFPANRLETLQSEFARDWGLSPNKDPTTNSHGTGTASKATGERFGAAKKATLVVYQVADTFKSELATAFNQGPQSLVGALTSPPDATLTIEWNL